MAITISVLSQKGGTGKTTTVRHLVGAFRQTGLRVLAVDLDPQGNLSDYFDIDPEAEPTIGDVLSGRASASAAIVDDVIPANLSLAEAEITLAGKMGRELTLRGALAELDDRYDIIFIDGDKSEFRAMLDQAKRMLRVEGLAIFNGVLTGGRTADAGERE